MNNIDHIDYRFEKYYNICSRQNLVGYTFHSMHELYEFIDELLEEKNSIIDSLNKAIIYKDETIEILKDHIKLLK